MEKLLSMMTRSLLRSEEWPQAIQGRQGTATAMTLRPCIHEMYGPRNGDISHHAQLPPHAMSWTRCIVMLLHNPPWELNP